MRWIDYLLLSFVLVAFPLKPTITIYDQAMRDTTMYRVGSIVRSTTDAYLEIEKEDGTISALHFDAGSSERYLYLAFLGDGAFAAVAEIGFEDRRSAPTYEVHAYSAQDNSLLVKPLPFPPIGFGNVDGTLWLWLANGENWLFDSALQTTSLPDTYRSDHFQMAYRGNANVDGTMVSSLDIELPGTHEITIDSMRGIVYAFRVVIPFYSSGLSDGLVSAVPVFFSGNGNLFLDGIPYRSQTIILQPGYHVMMQSGWNESKSFSFLITPGYSGFTEGEVMTAPVKIRSNASSMALNGIPYVPGSSITSPARYTLELICANGYIETHSFLLMPSIRGVSDQGVYEGKVVVYVNGVGYLDGERMADVTTVLAPGEHSIAIMWEDEVVQTVHFTIVSLVEEDVSIGKESLAQILMGCMGIVGLFWIFHKKKPQMPK